MADGSYNRILDLPWLVVDHDGDGVAEWVPDAARVDTGAPPADGHYQLTSPEPAFDFSQRRLYRVDGRQYDNWEDAKRAIIDESQTAPSDRMIQENRYEIGVPL